MAHPSGFTASEMTLHITAANAPAEAAAVSDGLRAYSVTAAAFPDFAPNVEERNAGGYLDEVDTILPVQELTFSVNIFDEKVFRAAMRPFQRLGALSENNAVAAPTDDSPMFEFFTTLTEQASAKRRAVRQQYQGRVRSALQSGFTPDGLQTFDVVVRPCYYYKLEVSNEHDGTTATALSFPATPAREVDLIAGTYKANGLDLWAARKKTLGL